MIANKIDCTTRSGHCRKRPWYDQTKIYLTAS